MAEVERRVVVRFDFRCPRRHWLGGRMGGSVEFLPSTFFQSTIYMDLGTKKNPPFPVLRNGRLYSKGTHMSALPAGTFESMIVLSPVWVGYKDGILGKCHRNPSPTTCW